MLNPALHEKLFKQGDSGKKDHRLKRKADDYAQSKKGLCTAQVETCNFVKPGCRQKETKNPTPDKCRTE
jgi:hypothetical protein